MHPFTDTSGSPSPAHGITGLVLKAMLLRCACPLDSVFTQPPCTNPLLYVLAELRWRVMLAVGDYTDVWSKHSHG